MNELSTVNQSIVFMYHIMCLVSCVCWFIVSCVCWFIDLLFFIQCNVMGGIKVGGRSIRYKSHDNIM